MDLGDVLEKQVVFMTGKGGVGKSTLSAALATAARDRGANVCLVEVDRSPSLRYIFGREIPVYKEVQVEKGLTVLTMEPFQALEEYTILQLKIASAARMILNNPLISYFMNAAPGWRELVTVGKIWHMAEQTEGFGRNKRRKWDMIVVDAPATGHGLSFLRVPSIFANILKFGRMQGQTKDLLDMLTDPDRTVLNVVSLPEEMPLNEALMILESTQETLKMNTGVVFMNGVHPPPFEEDEKEAIDKLRKDKAALDTLGEIFPDRGEALFDAARDQEKRAGLSQDYIREARERIAAPVVPIPYEYPGRVDWSGVKNIAEIIARAAEKGTP